MPRNQVFRLVDNAGRAVWIVAWGDNDVEHPAIEDKQEVLLFYALKCTCIPKVIGPSSIQGLSRQDALRYGLLVTLDQDEIFTKGKGVLGTCANKGSDVKFFVATPPSQAGVTACYIEEFEASTRKMNSKPTHSKRSMIAQTSNPPRTSSALLGFHLPLYCQSASSLRNSGEKNDDSDSDGGLWLFTSYILGMGASEEVPPFITKSQESELPTPYAANETRKSPLTFHYTGFFNNTHITG